MADLADDNAERAWALLLRVIALAGLEGEALCSAGADCLENLFRFHGPRFIVRIEHEARRDPKFRRALACVWEAKNPLRPRVDVLLAELGQPRLRSASGASGPRSPKRVRGRTHGHNMPVHARAPRSVTHRSVSVRSGDTDCLASRGTGIAPVGNDPERRS
jgi:hypothetical protein